MFNKTDDLEFKLLDDRKYIIEESNNQMKVLQYGMWGKKDEEIDLDKCRYEIRTIYLGKDGNEIMGKGVSLSEEGTHELTRILVDNNMGYTKDLLNSMKNRDDFMVNLKRVLKDDDIQDIDLDNIDDDYFDASSIFDNKKEES